MFFSPYKTSVANYRCTYRKLAMCVSLTTDANDANYRHLLFKAQQN